MTSRSLLFTFSSFMFFACNSDDTDKPSLDRGTHDGGTEAAVADSSSDSAATGRVCNPAEMPYVPIELQDILYVAADSKSVLYVLETSPEDSYRFFVSESEKLVRRKILGQGETNDGGKLTTITFEDGSIPSTFYALEETGGQITIALLRNKEMTDKRGIPVEAETLESKPSDAVKSMEVVNLPPARAVEYIVKRQSGEHFYIDRPESDWVYEDFRLFYGATSKMEEKRVTNVMRATDGGSTFIDFEIEGKKGYILFCTPLIANPPHVLSLDGVAENLEPVDSSAVGDMEFICHDFDFPFERPLEHSVTIEGTCKE